MADISEILRCPGPHRLFCDFDGSLAYIGDDPALTIPLDGIVQLLEELSEDWAVTAIVSGRPVAFLDLLFPSPSIDLYGLYGLEERVDGKFAPRIAGLVHWTKEIAAAASEISALAPVGVSVEAKGLSMTTHFRNAPTESGWVLEASIEAAQIHGLEMREARMSVELHPPVAIDKGTTVVDASRTVGAAIYIGDDVGDLAAFRGLRELEAQGHVVLCVAVSSNEVPEALIAEADYVVEGPDGVLAFLNQLLLH